MPDLCCTKAANYLAVIGEYVELVIRIIALLLEDVSSSAETRVALSGEHFHLIS